MKLTNVISPASANNFATSPTLRIFSSRSAWLHSNQGNLESESKDQILMHYHHRDEIAMHCKLQGPMIAIHSELDTSGGMYASSKDECCT